MCEHTHSGLINIKSKALEVSKLTGQSTNKAVNSYSRNQDRDCTDAYPYISSTAPHLQLLPL